VRERYGNLFDMYEKITGENAYQTPMRIYPAAHYTMGGLWVDYHLMSTVPGLFVLGEANFSDHGANRLGASALMQGLADGYFILPYTIGDYFAAAKQPKARADQPEFKKAVSDVTALTKRLLAVNGKRTVNSFHKELGAMVWEKCGMARNEKGLKELLQQIPALREEFWKNVKVAGQNEELNQNLEHAGRVADFLEFAELLCLDALHRRESCGGHFRTEFQTEDGEAKRDDENFAYVAAWEYAGPGRPPVLNKEPLVYEDVHMSTRSYK
jgi:succinate dehydrogenase / fumarate reductase flavoprotein subunit